MKDARRGGHLQWIMLAVITAIALIVYSGTWQDMVHTWRADTTFSHGMLIVPMSIYLAWQKRSELATIDTAVWWWGLVPLVIASGIWLLGTLIHVRVVQQAGFIAILQSLVPLLLGPAATRVLAFPIAFLWFALPVGKEIVPPLMEITADLSVLLLNLTGVPVYRDGMMLFIPAGTYEVARACSGVKFLTAAVALGTFYGYLTYRSLWKRALFVGFAIVVAILSNGVRAYILVLIGHLTDMTFQHDRWHIVLGYVVFAVALLGLFLVGSRFGDRGRPSDQIQTASVPVHRGRRPPGGLAVAAAAVILLVGTPAFAALVIQGGEESQSVSVMAAPVMAVRGWEVRSVAPVWRPHFSGGSTRLEQTFWHDAQSVDLFVEVFPLPSRAGAELIAYGNSIQRDANERLFPDRVIDPGIDSVRPGFQVRETVVQGSPDRLVWYWYDVGGQPATSGVRAKMLEASALLTAGRSAQRVVVLSTLVTSSRQEATERLHAFLVAHAAALGLDRVPGA